MINREITYKRDMGISYMIIPAMPEISFDEKCMLRKTVEGTLPMEKCYVSSVGQYWYNISGKQALDAYCRMHSVGKDIFFRIILRLCQLIERLEWRLIDINCLVLDPELIFINMYEEEVYFIMYPHHKDGLSQELQQLLEYLLARIDHKEEEAVRCAYQLYEMVLSESVSIEDIKRVVVKSQKVCTDIIPTQEPQKEEEKEPIAHEDATVYQKILEKARGKVQPYYDEVRKRISCLFPKEAPEPVIVYPEEEIIEEEAVHPTVCLASDKKDIGELHSDHRNVFGDYQLDKDSYLIGKSAKVDVKLDKDTASQLHARIEHQDGIYYIEDLNSTNGTYVNEELLSYKTRRALQSGDSVRFGDVRFHFYQ